MWQNVDFQQTGRRDDWREKLTTLLISTLRLWSNRVARQSGRWIARERTRAAACSVVMVVSFGSSWMFIYCVTAASKMLESLLNIWMPSLLTIPEACFAQLLELLIMARCSGLWSNRAMSGRHRLDFHIFPTIDGHERMVQFVEFFTSLYAWQFNLAVGDTKYFFSFRARSHLSAHLNKIVMKHKNIKQRSKNNYYLNPEEGGK